MNRRLPMTPATTFPLWIPMRAEIGMSNANPTASMTGTMSRAILATRSPARAAPDQPQEISNVPITGSGWSTWPVVNSWTWKKSMNVAVPDTVVPS